MQLSAETEQEQGHTRQAARCITYTHTHLYTILYEVG